MRGIAYGWDTPLLFVAAEEVQAVEINVLAAGATESITLDVLELLLKESSHTWKNFVV